MLNKQSGFGLLEVVVASAIGMIVMFALQSSITTLSKSSKRAESNTDLTGVKLSILSGISCDKTFAGMNSINPCSTPGYINLLAANGKVIVSKNGTKLGNWTVRAYCSSDLDVRTFYMLPSATSEDANFAGKSINQNKAAFRQDELFKQNVYDWLNPKSRIMGGSGTSPLCGEKFGGAATVGAPVPPFGIVMWSGSVANVPAGWAICDGGNGTPDLRGRFVVGVGGGYGMRQFGGTNAVTIGVQHMPSHNHSSSLQTKRVAVQAPGPSRAGEEWQSSGYDPKTNSKGWESMQWVDSPAIGLQGGGQPIDTRPPFYTLAYIMKLP